MRDVDPSAGAVWLVIQDDPDTPRGFVADLVRTVFGKSERETYLFIERVEGQGSAWSGPYPPPVAAVMFELAQQRVRAAGHQLRITGQTVAPDDDVSDQQMEYTIELLDWHFRPLPKSRLVATAREFPTHMRADVQAAVERLFATSTVFMGLDEESSYRTMSFGSLMHEGRGAQAIAPPQYHEVDTGEREPVKCLLNGLWLCRADEASDKKMPYAVLLAPHREDGRWPTVKIEILVPGGAEGEAFVKRTFAELEQAVHQSRCYRGKILSFDGEMDYRGRARGITVHKLPPVDRDEVILSETTLRLLDRNVVSFVGSRDALRRFGQSTRKGILLYGPPGTGKTHTIRYLASSLPDHTTLIITAAQMGLLGAYMTLARLLQPALVVIEDVDLIARDRGRMDGCEEPLLNQLLNEMDGLKQDADILFVLTTNRPEELEAALAGRPGRIDQAIEMPVPDADGRGKLIRLYGKNLPLDEDIIGEAVRRTDGVSAAFIKELMRRLAQASLTRDGGRSVVSADITEALDDMLFAGGRLNAKLLGGAQAMAAG